MLRPLSQWARRAARKAGFELRTLPRGEPAPVASLPEPTHAIYGHGDTIFTVPAEKCFYPYVFSYGPRGWHPFVETLREVRSDPSISYRATTLHRYYEAYQPRTIREVLFENGFEVSGAESLEQFSADRYLPLLPWDPWPRKVRGEKGLEPSHGNQGYGPVSEEKGELEFRRLTETMQSIERHGYRPALHGDGEIRGYFLKTADDYRFIIRSGLHRTAALVALGHEKIRVGLFKGYPRAVHICDLDSWPLVHDGAVTREAAEKYFGRFFNEDGHEKAGRLGLLNSPPLAEDEPAAAALGRSTVNGA